jgi:hypothetical protein
MHDLILILAATLVGAAWRVTDGGWHRIPGSTIMGYTLCVLVGFAAAGWLGVIPGRRRSCHRRAGAAITLVSEHRRAAWRRVPATVI